MTSREAFEKWWRSQPGQASMHDMAIAWAAWQERERQQAEALAAARLEDDKLAAEVVREERYRLSSDRWQQFDAADMRDALKKRRAELEAGKP